MFSLIEAREVARLQPPATWKSQRRFNAAFGTVMFVFSVLPILAAVGSWVFPWVYDGMQLILGSFPQAARPWIAAFLVVGASRILFGLRTATRRNYGRLELSIGFVTAYCILRSSTHVDLAAGISLASACYVCVRGFDNIKQGEAEVEALRDTLVSLLPSLTQRTYDQWSNIITQQHEAFANSASDEPHFKEASIVPDSKGNSYDISAEPWWYDGVDGDICIRYEIVRRDHIWRSATYELILKSRPDQTAELEHQTDVNAT